MTLQKSKFIRFILFFLSIVLVMIGHGIIIPIITDFITLEYIDPITVGIIIASYSFGSLVSAPFIGNYINKNSSRIVLQISLILYFISLLLVFSTSNILLIIIIRFISGILMSATFSAVETYISKYETIESQSKFFIIISSANSIGMTIGPVIGAFILYSNNLNLIYALGFIAILLSIAVHFSLTNEDKNKKIINPNQIFIFKEVKEIIKDKKTLFALGSFAMFGFITASFEGFGFSFLILKYHNTIQYYSITIILFEIIALVFFSLLYLLFINPKIVKVFNPFSILICSAFIAALSFFLMFWNLHFYFFILIVTISFVSLLIFSNSIILFLSISGPNKGLILGLKNSAMGIGAIFGPILSGVIYSFNSGYFLLMISLILFIISIFGTLFLNKN